MISFVHPGLLWALPLAAIPVLIHLIFLRRARKVLFSDLRLLRLAYLRSFSTSRLRQWILLAIRCLILALLVLIFARPIRRAGQLFRSASSAAAEDAAHVVLLADVSYSMGYRVEGRSRLERTIRAGEQILSLLSPQDRAVVVPFSDRLEGAEASDRLQWARDFAAASTVLRHLEPGNRTTDFVAALKPAYEFLRSSHARRKVIVMLSDNAAHGWRGVAPDQAIAGLPAYDPAISLLGLAWPDRPDNAALLAADLEPEGSNRQEILSARTFLDGAARQPWGVDVWQRERHIEERQFNLIAGENAPIQFQLPQEQDAWGRLELRNDALPSDDAFFYSFHVQQKPKVLLVRGGPRSLEVGHGGYFLKKLFLDPHGSLLSYDLEIADSIAFKSIPLENYRAVILIDFRNIPDDIAATLDRFVRAGGGVWLIPGASEGVTAWSSIAKLLPARIGDLMDYSGQRYGLKADETQLPQMQNARIAWRDFDLQNVEVRKAYGLAPNPDAKIWFRDAEGRPVMAFGNYGGGHVLVWSSSLDVPWTNLALKPVFAAWVDASLGALTGYAHRREWRTVKIGEPITRVWGSDEAAPSSVRIRGPQNRLATIRVTDRRLTYLADVPGFYILETVPTPEIFAVNLDRSTGESDLTPTANPPWQELGVATLKEDFIRALYGRELRTPMAVLLLAFFAAEALLANPWTKTRWEK